MTDRSDKTREAVKQALVGLMRRFPYESITVKQIVAESGVGRSTFYAYFEGKDELLAVVERELLEELGLYCGSGSSSPTRNAFDGMRAWFDACCERGRTLQVLTGPNGDPRFEGRLVRKVSRELHDMMSDEGVPNDRFRPYFEEMLGRSYVGLALYAVRQPEGDRLDSLSLAKIANHTRVAFFREHRVSPRLSDEALFGEAGEIF